MENPKISRNIPKFINRPPAAPNPDKQRGCRYLLRHPLAIFVIPAGLCKRSELSFVYGGFVRFTSTWCKTFAIILDIFILWIGPFIGCTDGEMVIGEVVGIELSNAAFQFEDAGVTGADELILDRELVTERLNEVVFGF